jgi:tetratricopeptide (TPR) repeat protein
LAGCGTSIPQRWQNFKAYYNTYYNAKTSFEAGLLKNQNLELNVVEGRPVRMFLPPGQAGYQELQNAIDKGADILRKHEKSDYIEPSLLLIGKSYFFRREFFSAQQKFGEIRRISNQPKLIQEAVFWEARTLFEMELYTQAVEFAEQQLLSIEEWDPRIEAETALILAESHVSLGNYLTAIDLIDPSLPQIKDKDLRARGYFLLGQLLQFEGEYELASEAFEAVIKSKRAYELIYQSQKQQAISLRESGDAESSEEIFSRLIRDDKNLEVRPELKVELARAYQKGGKVQEALELYDDVLRDPLQRPDKLTQAQSYYGIAEIYRETYDDFITASVYYDSAAAISLSEQERPPDFNVQELANIYGEYAAIQLEIIELDSLIGLALMPKAERDSVIEGIRNERRLIYEEEQRRKEEEQEVMVIVDQDDAEQESIPGLGFLNHLDQRRLQDAKIQFQALWNERALVDNWRRMEAVRAAPVQSTSQIEGVSQIPENEQISEQEVAVDSLGELISGADSLQLVADDMKIDGAVIDPLEQDLSIPEVEPLFVEDPLDGVLGIRLSDIPMDSIALAEAWQRYYARSYELANILTLSLELPDRASSLYRVIADSSGDSQLQAQALYVLTTVKEEQGDESQTLSTAKELIQRHPETIYARRVAEDFDLDSLLQNVLISVMEERESPKEEVSELIPDSIRISVDSLEFSADTLVQKVDSLSVIKEMEDAPVVEDVIPTELTLDQLLNALNLNQTLSIGNEVATLNQMADWLYAFAKKETNLERKPYLYFEAASLYTRLTLEGDDQDILSEGWEKVRQILNEFKSLFPGHPLLNRVNLILLEITPEELPVDSSLVAPGDSLGVMPAPADSLQLPLESLPAPADSLQEPQDSLGIETPDSLRNFESPESN